MCSTRYVPLYISKCQTQFYELQQYEEKEEQPIRRTLISVKINRYRNHKKKFGTKEIVLSSTTQTQRHTRSTQISI